MMLLNVAFGSFVTFRIFTNLSRHFFLSTFLGHSAG